MCYFLAKRKINTVSFCAFVYLFYDWETKTVFFTLNNHPPLGVGGSKLFGSSPLETRKFVLW